MSAETVDRIGFRIMFIGLMVEVLCIPLAIFGTLLGGVGLLPVVLVIFGLAAPTMFGGLAIMCASDRIRR